MIRNPNYAFTIAAGKIIYIQIYDLYCQFFGIRMVRKTSDVKSSFFFLKFVYSNARKLPL